MALSRGNILRRVLIMLLLVVVGGVTHAQIDASALMRAKRQGQDITGGYGSNPYDTTQGGDGTQTDGTNPADGEKGDTTKKKRPRKPLESYFFSDSVRALRNFQWFIDREYNTVRIEPIDTMLTVWRLDYPHYHKRLGNNSVGGLGQASTEVNFFERTKSPDFTFAQPYDAYTYRMETAPFYNMKHPYIWMTYLESGQKRYREEHFEITVSQNISPSTSVSLNYKARGAKGKYDVSRIKNQNFSGTVAHTGRRYSVFAGYNHNHIEQQESGGVVGDWAITDTTFEMPSGVPMRLAGAGAKNTYRNNNFFIKQSIGIPLARMTERDFSMAELPAVYIGHTFEFNQWSKIYIDKFAKYTDERYHRNEDGSYTSHTDIYYKNWYLNPVESRDSTFERIITNRLFVQAQPWDRNGVVGTLDGGVGLDLHTYSQFEPADYLSGKRGIEKRTSWFAYAGVQGKIRKYVDWGANFKIYPSGYRGGDYEIGARASFTAFIKKKPFTLSGSFSESMFSPSYWQTHWSSNHYRWDNDFGKQGETRFNVSFFVPDYGIELGFWQSILRNKIYYGADCLPVQHDGTVSLTAIYAQKNFHIKGLHLDHRVLVQLTTNHHVVPVPLVSAFLSYYYEFWVKKDVLRVQVGVDGRFNTKYYAQGYDPALSVFYNQNEVEVGNYPYLDAFISAKWKRMRILLKYQHWNKGLFGNQEYFAVARYPLNPGMFKLGISWVFYD
ncbi:MAG: putative porin [Alistipes sp.]|nr:putative porin [Alistipes sp.]